MLNVLHKVLHNVLLFILSASMVVSSKSLKDSISVPLPVSGIWHPYPLRGNKKEIVSVCRFCRFWWLLFLSILIYLVSPNIYIKNLFKLLLFSPCPCPWYILHIPSTLPGMKGIMCLLAPRRLNSSLNFSSCKSIFILSPLMDFLKLWFYSLLLIWFIIFWVEAIVSCGFQQPSQKGSLPSSLMQVPHEQHLKEPFLYVLSGDIKNGWSH